MYCIIYTNTPGIKEKIFISATISICTSSEGWDKGKMGLGVGIEMHPMETFKYYHHSLAAFAVEAAKGYYPNPNLLGLKTRFAHG